MKLYTAKVVAQWLCLTERRVRQLRDEGVIQEAGPGAYDLRPTVAKYITHIRGAGLNEERARLTAAKREAAELDNLARKGELHSTQDIERGIQGIILNTRSNLLSLPAKLSPALASMGGDREQIFAALEAAVREVLEDLSSERGGPEEEGTAPSEPGEERGQPSELERRQNGEQGERAGAERGGVGETAREEC